MDGKNDEDFFVVEVFGFYHEIQWDMVWITHCFCVCKLSLPSFSRN